MSTDDKPITTIESHVAWSCRWYKVRQDRILLPDGGEGEYNVIQMNNSVWVVPVTLAGDIVLIHNYRHTLGEWCWELPAGHIEPGQTAEEAARMELREEAGGEAQTLRFLMRISTLNGIGDHYGSFFLAMGVTLHAPAHERAEIITAHTFPRAEALRMARAGEINDAVSVLALLLAEPYLSEF